MDAIKLLGGLLGNRSQRGGGLGQQVLEHVLSEVQRKQEEEAYRQQQQTAAAQQAHARQQQYSQRGRNLNHVLRDAQQRYQHHVTPRRAAHVPARPHHQHHGYDDSELNRRSAVLIRAMINAAKSDGGIDQAEQQAIVSKLGNISREEAQFLNDEFRRPLDVHDFAHSVPTGMEEQVYAVSLMAIRLDTHAEARYLKELAECLRLDPRTRDEIHEYYHAPCLN